MHSRAFKFVNAEDRSLTGDTITITPNWWSTNVHENVINVVLKLSSQSKSEQL